MTRTLPLVQRLLFHSFCNTWYTPFWFGEQFSGLDIWMSEVFLLQYPVKDGRGEGVGEMYNQEKRRKGVAMRSF